MKSTLIEVKFKDMSLAKGDDINFGRLRSFICGLHSRVACIQLAENIRKYYKHVKINIVDMPSLISVSLAIRYKTKRNWL